MATAPTGDQILTPDDAVEVLEELLPSQNQSYVLGLKLGLPLYDVDNIFSTYSNPRDRLLHILIAFLKQVQPRPTWRIIVAALKSPAVNLPQLAERVEAAHFPDPTSARDAVPETTTTDGEAVASNITDTSGDVVKAASQVSSATPPVDTVQPPTTAQTHANFAATVPRSKPTSKQLTVQCHRKNLAPRGMLRGSATTDHRFSYFTPRDCGSVYSYQRGTEKWEELPRCPYQNSALVIINGELTAVGGWDSEEYHRTNKLVTLRDGQWVKEYRPMNTARSRTAVVSTSDGEYIIVIGGYTGHGSWATIVELFQVSTGRWYELTDLPQQPLPFPSATICGNKLHVIGDEDNGYSCSLQALLSSDRLITSQSIPHLISWTSLPRLPVTRSTVATLSGQLVIVGGLQDRSPVKSIHQLLDGQWVEIGSMVRSRRQCLVVSPSPNKIMIACGWGERRLPENSYSVEECDAV